MKDFFEKANLVKKVPAKNQPDSDEAIFFKKGPFFGAFTYKKVMTYLFPRTLLIKRRFYFEMIDYFCKKSKIPRSNYMSSDYLQSLFNSSYLDVEAKFLKGTFKEYLGIGPDDFVIKFDSK